MAFRDELDALRQRAEDAEKELASQTDRIGRVAEIEAQLEDARRQIREANLGRQDRVARWLAPLALGVGAGVALTYLWAHERLTSARTEHDLETAGLSLDARTAEQERATMAGELTDMTNARDEALASRDHANADLYAVVRLLAGEAGSPLRADVPSSTPLGYVTWSTNALYVPGERCFLVTPPSDARCVAEIRCGAPLVGFGCPETSTPIALRGDEASVALDGGEVVLHFGPPPPLGTTVIGPEGERRLPPLSVASGGR